MSTNPSIYTCLSQELIHIYNLEDTVVVVIDVLRATSTIAALLHMGAKKVIPVSTIENCIKIGAKEKCITAGERNGHIVPGLDKGNSPLQFSAEEVANKTVAITTTNGTALLNELLLHNANTIVTGSFVNISAVCQYLCVSGKNILLACAGWKGGVNMEDTLLAGAIVEKIGTHFDIGCDATIIAHQLYLQGIREGSLVEFMEKTQVSHYKRLANFQNIDDINNCFTNDCYPALPIYREGALYA